jgi:alkanesulfonate monooxygenase SsuD/methylene tetrahydromethanopterin reductase-like flavin-dependent oxidoreductase (luciferase family)
VPHFHPTLLAKQSSTVDHVSGGRFGLNIVSGADPAEFAMFGGTLRPHDQAYEYAEEWTQVLLRLWTSEKPFDFEGRFFHLKGAISQPTPIQKPYPAIMCANSSEVGKRFAARYADLSFVNFMSGELDDWKVQVEELKGMARREFGRELGIWTKAFVVCRPTQREADEYYDYVCIDKADVEGDPTRMFTGKDERKQVRESKGYFYKQEVGPLLRRNPGWPGHPLVGTAEQITAGLEKLSQAGIDGCLLFWVNFEHEQRQFVDEVLPLMEQAGLRKAFTPPAGHG